MPTDKTTRKAPMSWALDRWPHARRKGALTARGAFDLAGTCHLHGWIDGTEITEAEFDAGLKVWATHTGKE